MLIDYRLFDPITRLTLLVNENPQPSHLRVNKTTTNNDLTLSQTLNEVNLNYKYTRSSLTQRDYRKAIYEIAQVVKKTYQFHFDDISNWSGEYYPDLTSAIINPHHNGVYYVKILDNYQNIKIYHTSYAESDKLINKVLNESREQRFNPNINAFNALKNFWLVQADDHQHTPQPSTAISKTLNRILMHVIEDQQHNAKASIDLSEQITYQSLLDFYLEVQNQHLTSKSQLVQDWLFNDNVTTKDVKDMLNVLKLHTNYENFTNTLTDEADSDEIADILKAFQQDKYFPKLTDLDIHIYPIHQPIKHYHHQNRPVKHFIGIHGTNPYSIPTILCDGLKSMQELLQDHDAKFDNTGQALGDGTYFARLDQASKALNYTSTHFNRQYLLIADVSYQNPITVKQYSDRMDKVHDFVAAPSVGNSHNYDEYVAVYPQKQVNLKYLVEITHQ